MLMYARASIRYGCFTYTACISFLLHSVSYTPCYMVNCALRVHDSFDPNNADYDNRNALMVAAMKGNDEVVQMLLEYRASPNLTDMHGTTALMEAVKNGHEKTVTLLQKYGAELCMKEELAASVLCQAVFDGDILLLKRLVRTGIQVNAADYGKIDVVSLVCGFYIFLYSLVQHTDKLNLKIPLISL